ncbi:MAG TPA: glucosamine-6-phosphate deaminase, partial [Flavisolibacter sp.]
MNIDLTDSFERVPTQIFAAPSEGAKWVAQQVAEVIRQKDVAGGKCVLGLATGSTPKFLYSELVRLHKEEGLSFKNVVTFNLDEYYPIERDALQSYNRFMKTQLFNKVDIDPANCFIPDGEVPKENIKAHCAAYEKAIADAGGIDLQILGIGSNGHIGFNEPGSSIHSKTRLVNLEISTRLANAYEFAGMSDVPRLALTMGISTILKAKKIILMGWGNTKAPVVQKAVEGDVTEQVPASLLQTHDDVIFVVDESAAAELTRFKSPWLTGEIDWTSKMIKRAVVNMALQLQKPILSLTNNDYNEYGLSDLLIEKGDAYEINLQVFYAMRDSITGWPGGKPNANIPAHPERSEPYPKRCLIFSPHPDD